MGGPRRRAPVGLVWLNPFHPGEAAPDHGRVGQRQRFRKRAQIDHCDPVAVIARDGHQHVVLSVRDQGVVVRGEAEGQSDTRAEQSEPPVLDIDRVGERSEK